MIEVPALVQELKGFRKADLHNHTTYSDGKSRIEEYIKAARECGVDAIGFSDHVWSTTTWFDAYVQDIRDNLTGDIRVYTGLEAKVVNLAGDIDARREFVEKAEIVFGAMHRIPKEKGFMSQEEVRSSPGKALDFWLEATLSLLRNPWVNVIAHPTHLLKENGMQLTAERMEEIAKAAAENNKAFEISIMHGVPDGEFVRILKGAGVPMTYGSDSHSVDEFRRYSVYCLNVLTGE